MLPNGRSTGFVVWVLLVALSTVVAGNVVDTQVAANQVESTPNDAGGREVYINRVRLGAERVAQLERQYNARIVDGRYWYDAACGAWGVDGGPTAGFLIANLELPGPMPVDISGGGTAIYINGREIHVQDQVALFQIFGVTVPGRYWLDARGNLGLEGGSVIANLATAIQSTQGNPYGSVTSAGGTVAGAGQSVMFSGRTGTGKSIFWSN